MKPCLSVLLVSMTAATFASTVIAVPTGAAPEKGQGAYPMDCTRANDKARCAALNQKIQGCKEKTDDEWRACMYPSVPTANFTPPRPRDCRVARNKELCNAHASALEACKDKRTRAEHRKCIARQLQPTSLTKN